MVVVAIAIEKQGYIYAPKTAHKVNAQKAQRIAGLLNASRYHLKEGYVWHVYDVGPYDSASVWAEEQEFRLGKNLTRRASLPFDKI